MEQNKLEEKIENLSKQIELLTKNLPAVVSPPPVLELPSIEDLKNHLCPGISDSDAYIFLQTAKAFGLNPFKKEIYIVPFGKRFSAIIDYHVFLSKAKQNPTYLYFEVNLRYDKDKKVDGAWCKIYDKNFGLDDDGKQRFFYHEIDAKEYDKEESTWKTKRNTMLKKTAIRQAHNLCYPELVGLPPTRDELIDANGVVVDEKGKLPPPPKTFEKPKIDDGFFTDVSGPDPEESSEENGKITESQIADMFTMLKDAKITTKKLQEYCQEDFGFNVISHLNKKQYKKCLEWIKENAK